MPVNFQQIYTRIHEIAQSAQDNKRILEEHRILARELLAVYASELDYISFVASLFYLSNETGAVETPASAD